MGVIKDMRIAKLREQVRKCYKDIAWNVQHGRYRAARWYGRHLLELEKTLRGLLASGKAEKNMVYKDDWTINQLVAKMDFVKKVINRMHELNNEYRKVWGNIDLVECSDEEKTWLREALKDNGEIVPENYKVFSPAHFMYLHHLKESVKKRIANALPDRTENTILYDDDNIQVVDNVEFGKIQVYEKHYFEPEIALRLKKKNFLWSPSNQAYVRIRTKRAVADLEMIFGIELTT